MSDENKKDLQVSQIDQQPVSVDSTNLAKSSVGRS